MFHRLQQLKSTSDAITAAKTQTRNHIHCGRSDTNNSNIPIPIDNNTVRAKSNRNDNKSGLILSRSKSPNDILLSESFSSLSMVNHHSSDRDLMVEGNNTEKNDNNLNVAATSAIRTTTAERQLSRNRKLVTHKAANSTTTKVNDNFIRRSMLPTSRPLQTTVHSHNMPRQQYNRNLVTLVTGNQNVASRQRQLATGSAINQQPAVYYPRKTAHYRKNNNSCIHPIIYSENKYHISKDTSVSRSTLPPCPPSPLLCRRPKLPQSPIEMDYHRMNKLNYNDGRHYGYSETLVVPKISQIDCSPLQGYAIATQPVKMTKKWNEYKAKSANQNITLTHSPDSLNSTCSPEIAIHSNNLDGTLEEPVQKDENNSGNNQYYRKHRQFDHHGDDQLRERRQFGSTVQTEYTEVDSELSPGRHRRESICRVKEWLDKNFW